MNQQASYSDRELLHAVSNADESAFRELFYRYHQKLAGWVMGWTKNEQQTEDIVQDVFLKVWVKREALSGINNFDNYLYILSRNHSYNALRQISRDRLKKQAWLKELEAGEELTDADLFEAFGPLLEEAINRLPEQQRKVYELKYQQKLKYEQIGQQLGISPETARKHLQTATKSMAAYVQANRSIILFLLTAPVALS